MKSRLILKILFLATIMYVLPACAALRPEGSDTGPTNVRITSPGNNTVLSTGTLITIQASAYIALRLGGIDSFEFFVNGRSIGMGEATASTSADRTHTRTAPRTGEYMVQAVASNSEGTRIISDPVRVCVVDAAGLPTEGASLEYPSWGCHVPARPVIPVSKLD